MGFFLILLIGNFLHRPKKNICTNFLNQKHLNLLLGAETVSSITFFVSPRVPSQYDIEKIKKKKENLMHKNINV